MVFICFFSPPIIIFYTRTPVRVFPPGPQRRKITERAHETAVRVSLCLLPATGFCTGFFSSDGSRSFPDRIAGNLGPGKIKPNVGLRTPSIRHSSDPTGTRRAYFILATVTLGWVWENRQSRTYRGQRRVQISNADFSGGHGARNKFVLG